MVSWWRYYAMGNDALAVTLFNWQLYTYYTYAGGGGGEGGGKKGMEDKRLKARKKTGGRE